MLWLGFSSVLKWGLCSVTNLKQAFLRYGSNLENTEHILLVHSIKFHPNCTMKNLLKTFSSSKSIKPLSPYLWWIPKQWSSKVVSHCIIYVEVLWQNDDSWWLTCLCTSECYDKIGTEIFFLLHLDQGTWNPLRFEIDFYVKSRAVQNCTITIGNNIHPCKVTITTGRI